MWQSYTGYDNMSLMPHCAVALFKSEIHNEFFHIYIEFSILFFIFHMCTNVIYRYAHTTMLMKTAHVHLHITLKIKPENIARYNTHLCRNQTV